LRAPIVKPTFFGDPPLFGMHHPPSGTASKGGNAVLVCPPIGHEHTRAHRALRVLAEALARAGRPVLRFDYRGLGDSWGDLSDGGVDPWCEDLARALEQLQLLSRPRQIDVVGLRVGAALAATTLARGASARSPVRRLVLWDPTMSGESFLSVAVRFQTAFLNDPARFPKLKARGRPSDGRAPGDDLLGYPYPAALRQSLLRLDLRSLPSWPRVATHVVLSSPDPDTEKLAKALSSDGGRVTCEVVDEDGAWEDYSRHELTLRAGRSVRNIVQRLKEET